MTETKQPTKPATKKGKTTKPVGKEKTPGVQETGRPSKFTDDVIAKITDAISIGCSYELASLYSGISYPTFQNWMRQARIARAKEETGERLTPSETRFLKFLREVEAASAEAGVQWQQTVNTAARRDPIYAMQMLRLRFSGYTEKTPVQWTAELDYSNLTDEQLQRIANGEDPADVIASGTQGAGNNQSAGGNSQTAGSRQQPAGK